MAIPAFETMPPVVTSIGSTCTSLPPPIGVSSGTGRTSISTTHEPHSTQSNVFSVVTTHLPFATVRESHRFVSVIRRTSHVRSRHPPRDQIATCSGKSPRSAVGAIGSYPIVGLVSIRRARLELSYNCACHAGCAVPLGKVTNCRPTSENIRS